MGKIERGITDITSVRRGQTAVSKVYRGRTLIWEPVAPGPSYVTTNLYQYIDPFRSTISGGTATDLSGNGRSATLVNSIASVGSLGGGNSGWQLNVKGSSAKSLNLGLNNTDFNTAGGTLEIWFKINTADWDSEPGMIYQYRTSPDRQFGMGMKSTADKRFYSQLLG